MINSWTLLIVKAIDNKHVIIIYILTSLPFANILQKTSCKNSEKYKSYNYLKKAYKHNAEHDVAKTLQFLGFFLCQYGVFFSKDMF